MMALEGGDIEDVVVKDEESFFTGLGVVVDLFKGFEFQVEL